ncbi:hypothetical protein GCM10008983_12480 [Lentibacillus halophilus]|uniref:DoxX family protein n=1 Tax=Lentibacillus halophilus TaxID=295065 RepID=A0ABN0Z7P0_9BACI
MQTMNWIGYAIGYVFFISGVCKLVNSDFQTVFANLGLPFPEKFLFLVAITELACSVLIIGRIYVRQAATALMIIIIGAIYVTKIPVLMNQGVLSFAFEARLDIVMLILLLLLWQHKPGQPSS